MQCSKCSSPKVIVESLGTGVTKATCQECGHAETRNAGGQRLLTDDMPARQQPVRVPRPLTEG
jgi:hypothetical protein